MYFGANSRCRLENSVEKAAVFFHPLYIIGLKIIPRDVCKSILAISKRALIDSLEHKHIAI